ncbi:hypothetical protein LCGC14_2206120 [marine sediment metagenome]|uniref:Uncharacterized protein n=1 Tax=marine sediment metagenome TaxID=412755 RepID=A0A0F9GB37_9ZZZZ
MISLAHEELVDKIIKILAVMSEITDNSDKFTIKHAKKIISEFGGDPALLTFRRTKSNLYIIYNKQKLARVKKSRSFSIPTELKYQFAESIAKNEISNLCSYETLLPYLKDYQTLV